MNGKENIINKILADAEEKCQEILSAAHTQAQEITDLSRAFADAETQASKRRLQSLSDERKRNSIANARLDGRKYKLLQKQKLISSCYDKAVEEMKKMPVAGKKAFLTRLIETYAEQGETVRPCKTDVEIVTQKFLDGFKKGLVLGKPTDAEGGLIFEGVGYDKDLTLAKFVAYIREQTESSVSRALFGE